MAEEKPTTAYLCGQLYATLNVLCVISTRSRRLESVLELRRVRNEPRNRLDAALAEAAQYLMKARSRGPQHIKAADELFRAITGLIPADGRLPAYFYNGGHDQFDAGFRSRMDACTAAHGSLMQ